MMDYMDNIIEWGFKILLILMLTVLSGGLIACVAGLIWTVIR